LTQTNYTWTRPALISSFLEPISFFIRIADDMVEKLHPGCLELHTSSLFLFNPLAMILNIGS